jgi:hypothetical protein
MRQIKLLALAALAVCALGATVVSTAQAIEGPFYKLCEPKTGGKFEDNECSKEGTTKAFEKVRLLEGENRALEAALSEEYTLKSTGITIKCKGTKLESAWLLGSTGASAGSSLETVVFEKCTVTENGEPCEPFSEKKPGTKELGVIRTRPVLNTQDFANKTSVKGEVLLTFFQPVKNPVFVVVKFTGAGCKVTSIAIEGTVAAEDLEGAKAPVKVEETEKLAEVGYVRFPAAQIKKDFLEEEGVRREVKPELKAGGLKAELTGGTEIKLATKEHWGVFTK